MIFSGFLASNQPIAWPHPDTWAVHSYGHWSPSKNSNSWGNWWTTVGFNITSAHEALISWYNCKIQIRSVEKWLSQLKLTYPWSFLIGTVSTIFLPIRLRVTQRLRWASELIIARSWGRSQASVAWGEECEEHRWKDKLGWSCVFMCFSCGSCVLVGFRRDF